MAKEEKIVVPDIGAATDVEVIEVFVSPGDKIAEEDSIITLESDKASMEIPAPYAGIVKDIQVKVGDKVSQGAVILTLESAQETVEEKPAPKQETVIEKPLSATEQPQESIPEKKIVSELKEVTIPDIGTTDKVDVIEVNVTSGQIIAKDDTLVTLESEKASMELPSPYAGEIKELKVAVGNKVMQGDMILTMQVLGVSEEASRKVVEEAVLETVAPAIAETPVKTTVEEPIQITAGVDIHAGPGVRRVARELGVDLHQVKGTGAKARITYDDVHSFVKNIMTGKSAPTAAVAPMPAIDFSQFGDIETKPLSKIKRLTGTHVHRSWVTAPHVTQFDEADITEMDAFRKAKKSEAEKLGFKLTPLVFLMKAVVACLKKYPSFNASLDPTAENLILKKYFNIGVAVETPNGLVVPVVRNVDQKGLYELADELGKISKKAREKGLMPTDMQGSCFTISSLGGIGGTAFTPIINMPDVAILGVSKAQMKPIYQNGEFVPRLMLPLSLSYDHRVIDGAEAARFTAYLAILLSDLRQMLL